MEGESTADVVGKLMASLYGTRDASANWQEEVNKPMQQRGFKTGKYGHVLTFTKKVAYDAWCMEVTPPALPAQRT